MPVQPDNERVYWAIRQRIERGEWPPGHALPSTTALATEFGVSTGTVLVAAKWLVREGWLIGHPGKGRYVADPLPYT
jgi:GntR family transcriptional regulator